MLQPAPTEEEYLEAVGEGEECEVDGEREGWAGSDGGLFWKEDVYQHGKEVRASVLGCLLERFFMEMCAPLRLDNPVAQKTLS